MPKSRTASGATFATFSGLLTASGGATIVTQGDATASQKPVLHFEDQNSGDTHTLETRFSTTADGANAAYLKLSNISGGYTEVWWANASGNFGVTNACYAVSFVTTSDQSVKEDVEDVDLSPVFDAVAVKSYTREDKPEMGRRVGFLSQDVAAACASSGLPDTFTAPMDDTGLLGLDYGRLTTVLWSVCKRQQAALAALEARLRAIEIAIESAQ